MKRFLVVLIPLFILMGCNMNTSVFDVCNHADCSVTISNGKDSYTLSSNQSMSITGDYSSCWNIKDSEFPCKINQSSRKVDIYNNYTITKLNVKNNTTQTVTFKILNNPQVTSFSVNAQSNDIFNLKTSSPQISNASNNFYTLNKIDGELYLIFN